MSETQELGMDYEQKAEAIQCIGKENWAEVTR